MCQRPLCWKIISTNPFMKPREGANINFFKFFPKSSANSGMSAPEKIFSRRAGSKKFMGKQNSISLILSRREMEESVMSEPERRGRLKTSWIIFITAGFQTGSKSYFPIFSFTKASLYPVSSDWKSRNSNISWKNIPALAPLGKEKIFLSEKVFSKGSKSPVAPESSESWRPGLSKSGSRVCSFGVRSGFDTSREKLDILHESSIFPENFLHETLSFSFKEGSNDS